MKNQISPNCEQKTNDEKRREIVIELERTRIVACRVNSVSTFCLACSADSEFVEPIQAAALCETDAEKIFALAEAGVVHSIVVNDCLQLVCLASLLGTSFV